MWLLSSSSSSSSSVVSSSSQSAEIAAKRDGGTYLPAGWWAHHHAGCSPHLNDDDNVVVVRRVRCPSSLRFRRRRRASDVVGSLEFSGAVAEYGPDCRKRVPTGAPVVALPLLRGSGGVDPVGLSAAAPGAYAEQVLVQESMMMPVTNGLPVG